jgi:hypothetical protein
MGFDFLSYLGGCLGKVDKSVLQADEADLKGIKFFSGGRG